MNAEGPHKPSVAEQEQTDKDDIRQSIELPLRGIKDDLSSIEITLEAWGNKEDDRSPLVKEDIDNSIRIASEIRHKLTELDALFRSASPSKE